MGRHKKEEAETDRGIAEGRKNKKGRKKRGTGELEVLGVETRGCEGRRKGTE